MPIEKTEIQEASQEEISKQDRSKNEALAKPQKKKSKWPLTLIIIFVSLIWLLDGYLICRLFSKAEDIECAPCSKAIVSVPVASPISEPAVSEPAVSGQPLPEQARGTFYQSVLKFAVDFPESWGPVSTREDYKMAPDGSMVIVGLSLTFDGIPGRPEFAYASYPDAEALMSGGGLGAEAVRISSLYDLRNWCVGKSGCENFSNSQNMPFVRQDMIAGDGVGGQRTVRRYYMYNAASGYRGVVFSTENLGTSAGELEKVVNSVRAVE